MIVSFDAVPSVMGRDRLLYSTGGSIVGISLTQYFPPPPIQIFGRRYNGVVEGSLLASVPFPKLTMGITAAVLIGR